MIAVLERADEIQPGCRVVLGKEKEKEILAAIGSHSAASVGREGKWLQAEVCHTIINMVPLDRKLASLNHRELLHAHSTHSWGGISAPFLKPRLLHLAMC